MTRLLVSVRNATEAQAALAAGTHLIDIKEPARGSLGAADPEQIDTVLAAVAGGVPVSAAWGELFQADPSEAHVVRPALRFVKWGLAGAADVADWPDAWSAEIGKLPPSTSAVAVQYADWRRARSPSPRELLAACRQHDVRTLLVDTHDKTAGNLLDVWPLASLCEFVAAARDARMTIVLGGSLTHECLPKLLALKPDYVAVRGAACTGGRTGTIDPQRVQALVRILAQLEL